MRHKSLRTLLQIMLLGVVLGSASNAYADAFSSITFNNFSIVTAAGNPITFGSWQGTVRGADTLEGVNTLQTASTSGGTVQVSATSPLLPGLGVSFARGFGQVDAANVTGSAFGQVFLSGCTCAAQAEGRFGLSNTFIVTGGTGSVDVTITLSLSTLQRLANDEFDLSSAAQHMFDLSVDGMRVFSVDSLVGNLNPNSFLEIGSSQFLSRTITLQFNTPHTITITASGAVSGAAEIPEPATLFLLGSGLGLVSGAVKKRSRRFSRS